MEQFPLLEDYQVALMRAQLGTGHVVDENCNLALNDGQKVYTIFKDFEQALGFAKEFIKENPEIECVIYNKEKKVLSYLKKENIMNK